MIAVTPQKSTLICDFNVFSLIYFVFHLTMSSVFCYFILQYIDICYKLYKLNHLYYTSCDTRPVPAATSSIFRVGRRFAS